LAATIAWVIAKYGLGHEQPFFAPVAAVIALNTTVGERGLNAVRLLEAPPCSKASSKSSKATAVISAPEAVASRAAVTGAMAAATPG
jgi:hypothetical protein